MGVSFALINEHVKLVTQRSAIKYSRANYIQGTSINCLNRHSNRPYFQLMMASYEPVFDHCAPIFILLSCSTPLTVSADTNLSTSWQSVIIYLRKSIYLFCFSRLNCEQNKNLSFLIKSMANQLCAKILYFYYIEENTNNQSTTLSN